MAEKSLYIFLMLFRPSMTSTKNLHPKKMFEKNFVKSDFNDLLLNGRSHTSNRLFQYP